MVSESATRTASAQPSTPERILDVAQGLAQTRGYNGFSYADIAVEIGVTKASLHYHFPSKAALGLALVERYGLRFEESLTEIAALPDSAAARLRRYVDVYRGVLVQDRLCLCAMFAAEITTLPAPVQLAVRRFFETNERWVADLLAEGRRQGTLAFPGEPIDAARAFVAALDGSMLLARSFGDASRFEIVAERALADLERRG